MEKNKKIIAGIAGAVALIAIVAVCIFAFGSGKEKKITENKETTTVAETTTVPETTAQPKGISMLTGEHISEKLAEKRPVAVMYNNIINAIPHSGIDNAGIVYEAPVEGSITRLMALFENYGKLKKIGSVRSCRLYYCYFALEWDAIYCHFGQSKYALDFLKSDAIDNVGSFNAESGFTEHRTELLHITVLPVRRELTVQLRNLVTEENIRMDTNHTLVLLLTMKRFLFSQQSRQTKLNLDIL